MFHHKSRSADFADGADENINETQAVSGWCSYLAFICVLVLALLVGWAGLKPTPTPGDFSSASLYLGGEMVFVSSLIQPG